MPRCVTATYARAEATLKKLKATNEHTLKRTIHEISQHSTEDDLEQAHKVAEDFEQDFKKLKSRGESMKSFVENNKSWDAQ